MFCISNFSLLLFKRPFALLFVGSYQVSSTHSPKQRKHLRKGKPRIFETKYFGLFQTRLCLLCAKACPLSLPLPIPSPIFQSVSPPKTFQILQTGQFLGFPQRQVLRAPKAPPRTRPQPKRHRQGLYNIQSPRRPALSKTRQVGRERVSSFLTLGGWDYPSPHPEEGCLSQALGAGGFHCRRGCVVVR